MFLSKKIKVPPAPLPPLMLRAIISGPNLVIVTIMYNLIMYIFG